MHALWEVVPKIMNEYSYNNCFFLQWSSAGWGLCDGVRWQPRSPWQEKGYVLVFRLQIFEIQNTGIHAIILYLS